MFTPSGGPSAPGRRGLYKAFFSLLAAVLIRCCRWQKGLTVSQRARLSCSLESLSLRLTCQIGFSLFLLLCIFQQGGLLYTQVPNTFFAKIMLGALFFMFVYLGVALKVDEVLQLVCC